jgi:hypothetical protein
MHGTAAIFFAIRTFFLSKDAMQNRRQQHSAEAFLRKTTTDCGTRCTTPRMTGARQPAVEAFATYNEDFQK